jgi:hypothetical protein
MGILDRWLLPDGVEDMLPSQAKKNGGSSAQVAGSIFDLGI